jgi:electron transfer flavoprotein beta subunit
VKLDIAGGRGAARRELEGAAELVEFPLPAAVTIDEGIARPRYPSLKGIMAAKKKPLEVKTVTAESGGIAVLELALPPARKEGRILGDGPGAVPMLIDALRNEAKVI